MNPAKTSGNKNLRANIVVIGAGGAGLSAAVAAAEAGVKGIIVLEAHQAPGGNSVFPGGLLAAETPLQKRLGVDAPRDMVYRQAMEYAHWKLNGRLVRALVNKSGDTIRWLEQKGLVFTQLTPHYPNPVPNTFHALSGKGRVKTGAAIVKALVRNCQELGVTILVRTPARKMLTDEKGRVSGVLAESKDGQLHISTRSTITATGGFSGNKALLRKYDPLYNEAEVIHGGIRLKGDGMLMAMEIGAATDEQVTLEMFGPQFPDSMRLTFLSKKHNVIWVNQNGERFADENTASDMEAANIIYRLPHKICYSLLDEKILSHSVQDALSPLDQMMMDEASFRDGLAEDIKLQAREGRIKISNSWDEIAAWIGADPEVLKHTVKEYNNSCDHGYDEVFLKERRYLMPLRNPPYYAIPGKVSIVVTHGGIKTNHRLEALDNEGWPIPGLYAAGVEIAGTEANTYNMFLSGHSFGFAINSGRIAGEEAARYISADK
jgi:fumarate reductase flavoprotein subunit